MKAVSHVFQTTRSIAAKAKRVTLMVPVDPVSIADQNMHPAVSSPKSLKSIDASPGILNSLWVASFLLVALFPAHLLGQMAESKISLLDGSEIQGEIRSIDENGTVTGDRLPAGLQLSDISSIDLTVKPQPANHAGRIAIGLVNGSRLLGNGLQVEGELLRFESAIGIDSLPLQVIRSIVWKDSELLKQQLNESLAAEDRVIVESVDGERMIQGLIEGLTAQQLSIQYQNQSRKIAVEKINAVIMADIGLKPPQGSIASIEFNDNSVLKGLLQKLENEIFTLQLADSVSVEFPASQVLSISIMSDRQLFLSDLEPIDVQQKTEFTIQRQWQRDLSVQGSRLTLAVGESNQLQEFIKGLGTQSFIQLDYANENGFTKFKAIVGIDGETKGKGDCRMVVRGDGIELWSSRIKGSETAREIDVDISGIKVVSLIVEPGESFDLADHANWCNARFIK